MTALDRFATALEMFLEIRRTTFGWTRGLIGEGPATIQRSRRQLSADLDDLSRRAR
jgi:hypothetical protein